MLSLLWSWVDGRVQLVLVLCLVVISLSDKLVRCEEAECELRPICNAAETAGKLTSWCLVGCFVDSRSVFEEQWSVCERGRDRASDSNPDPVVPRVQAVVEWERRVVVNAGRVRYLEEFMSMRSCSFLFLLSMTSCSWFHDLTVIDSSFSSLWYFKFNRRSSKEFCFDKLFQISCSKYFDVAFR